MSKAPEHWTRLAMPERTDRKRRRSPPRRDLERLREALASDRPLSDVERAQIRDALYVLMDWRGKLSLGGHKGSAWAKSLALDWELEAAKILPEIWKQQPNLSANKTATKLKHRAALRELRNLERISERHLRRWIGKVKAGHVLLGQQSSAVE